MIYVDYILAVLSGVGLAYIIATAKIFKAWREAITRKYPNTMFNTLINCPQCLSVWCAFVMYFIIHYLGVLSLSAAFSAYLLTYLIAKIK